MIQSISIKNVAKKEKTIEVGWSDGKKSNFHFLWLRDNCPSDIHPTAKERLFNLMSVTENIHPESYIINNKGELEIKWSEGNHVSKYDSDWLNALITIQILDYS